MIKPSVYLTNQLVQVLLELLVLLDICSAGDRDLEQHHLTEVLRVVRQESLKCLESVGKTLRVISPVNPENDLKFIK